MRKQTYFRFLNETPGALRYREIDDKGNHIKRDEEGALVGDLYLRKLAMEGVVPENIVVTLDY
jgi:hypothetical protein